MSLLRDVSLPTNPREPVDETSLTRNFPAANTGAARAHASLTKQQCIEQLTWLQTCTDNLVRGANVENVNQLEEHFKEQDTPAARVKLERLTEAPFTQASWDQVCTLAPSAACDAVAVRQLRVPAAPAIPEQSRQDLPSGSKLFPLVENTQFQFSHISWKSEGYLHFEE